VLNVTAVHSNLTDAYRYHDVEIYQYFRLITLNRTSTWQVLNSGMNPNSCPTKTFGIDDASRQAFTVCCILQ